MAGGRAAKFRINIKGLLLGRDDEFHFGIGLHWSFVDIDEFVRRRHSNFII